MALPSLNRSPPSTVPHKPGFFDLPAEVRNMIYGLMLKDLFRGSPISPKLQVKAWTDSLKPNHLLRLSKDFYKEL